MRFSFTSSGDTPPASLCVLCHFAARWSSPPIGGQARRRRAPTGTMGILPVALRGRFGRFRMFRRFSCDFVRRECGVACSARRRGSQGWRWRACTARRSRGKAPSPTAPSRRKSALRHAAFRVSRVSASQSRQSCHSCHILHLTRNLHIYINAMVATRRTPMSHEANFILPRLRHSL